MNRFLVLRLKCKIIMAKSNFDTLCTSVLQDKIRCIEFKNCLFRLAKHENRQDFFSDTEIETQVDKLANIEIYEVSERLHWGNMFESDRSAPYVINKIEENGKKTVTVYINVAAELTKTDALELNSILVDAINFVTSGLIQSNLHIVCLLLMINVDEMTSFLNRLKIKEDSRGESKQLCTFDKLGSFVPIAMHHLLRQDFLPFTVGDVVAQEIGDDDGYDDDEDPVYVFVKIEEINSSESVPNVMCKVNAGENETQYVSAIDLYAFARSIAIEQKEIALLNSDVEERDSMVTDDNTEFDVITSEINKILTNSERLSNIQKDKVIKRLFLHWCPDNNNPEKTELCTKVVQTLEEMINLHCVKSVDGTNLGDRFNANRYLRRARLLQQFKENFDNMKALDVVDGFSNPQPSEARRWIRQAEFDMNSAVHDYLPEYYEWTCYKFHQAAEKALKAMQFMRNIDQSFSHDLASICSGLESNVITWANSLDKLLPYHTNMRYPHVKYFPKVPHELYKKDFTDRVAELAKNIVRFARDKIR